MFQHTTVLLEEAVDGLQITPNGIYVDCTLGGAGHSQHIYHRLGPEGMLIGLDRDETALKVARERLLEGQGRLRLLKTDYRYLRDVLVDLGIKQVNGFLFDLGVSSPQLDQAERGFSYWHEAPLDMRMDQDQELTAFEIVNNWSEEDLIQILYTYGEERFARRIARKIITHRDENRINSTQQLVNLIKEAIPAPARRKGPHPARRTFQALRIAVNDELNGLREALQDAISLLAPGGRISVISFHSLEDRICKQLFQEQARGCICSKKIPVCVCGQEPVLNLITRKPIVPTIEEIERNSRARSAKLRIVEKRVYKKEDR